MGETELAGAVGAALAGREADDRREGRAGAFAEEGVGGGER